MLKGLARKFYIGLGLFVVLSLLAFFGVFRFHIDLADSLWAVAGIMLVYIVWQVVSYINRPKKTVHISTKVTLSAPSRLLKHVQNYKLNVSTEKHIEEKGKERVVQMDELSMSFNNSDHPDAYAYCMQLIGHHMDVCLQSARTQHPDAEVIANPPLLPPAMLQLEAKKTS